MFFIRRLLEVQISTLDYPEVINKELEDWLQSHSTFIHFEASEFILYLPDDKEGFEAEYGKAPEVIKPILKDAWEKRMKDTREAINYIYKQSEEVNPQIQSEAADMGYLLIVLN